MKNQISALSDPSPSVDDLLKKKSGVGGSCLIYLLLIPFYHLSFVSQDSYCISKCVTEPPVKMMPRLEAVDQMYSSIYDE